MNGQPKLFGGSLEEYLESTNQEIPLIMKSCIRVINLYGLHHQGIFRVSGSQVEINNFREWFERGEDPLADVTDASDINSVAGVLKLYLRELREPLFPIIYFEQLMELAQLESRQEFVNKMKEMISSLSRPVVIVMRYLFAFLNQYVYIPLLFIRTMRLYISRTPELNSKSIYLADIVSRSFRTRT